MTGCRSFPASIAEHAEILILGSMPGRESLRQQQYYAHKRNVFWRMMGDIFDFGSELPYPERLEQLKKNRIALWDVLAGCDRAGSLDCAIRRETPNDVQSLLNEYPSIRRIGCNGSAAGGFLQRYFPLPGVPVTVLPSSSPAAARLTYDEKLTRWRDFLTKGN